jgi:hypothetical protein
MSIDSDLDRLYQLKPSEFTAERNAIAKRAGPRAADIRALPKPTAAVWAVNQLYWRQGELYRSLIRAAENLRATHKAVMAGRRADLRVASRVHEEALEAALKATLEIAGEDGHAPSDATRQAIGTTLRGLPADDAPGRLRQALAPGGFEMLSGLPAGGRVISAPARQTHKRTAGKETAAGAPQEDKAAQERAKKQAETAAKAVAAAEQAARREEFEAARASREAEKAERRLARAREALEAAEAELQEAEREVERARKKRDAAKARSDAADQALADARARVS